MRADVPHRIFVRKNTEKSSCPAAFFLGRLSYENVYQSSAEVWLFNRGRGYFVLMGLSIRFNYVQSLADL